MKHSLRIVVSRVGDHAHDEEEEEMVAVAAEDDAMAIEKEEVEAETFSLLAMDKSGKRKLGLGIGMRREIIDHFESRDNLIDTLLSSKAVSQSLYAHCTLSFLPFSPLICQQAASFLATMSVLLSASLPLK